MKKYEFVTLDYEAKNVVVGSMAQHREIIAAYAQKGYRFVSAIPTEVNANGYPRKLDLVFETDVE
jgi:hypothetical protein